MKDIKDRAREYLIKHSEYSEVFDQTFVAVDTLTAMVDFAEQENAELKSRVENQKSFLERIRAKFNLGELERKEIEGYLEGEKLTKAKEIIKKLRALYSSPVVTNDDIKRQDEILAETEQFLKECE